MKQKDFEAFARNSLYRLVSCANSKTVGKFNFSYLFPQYALFRARFRGKQNGRRLCFKFFPFEIVKKLSESLQIKFWGKKISKQQLRWAWGKKGACLGEGKKRQKCVQNTQAPRFKASIFCYAVREQQQTKLHELPS